MTQDTVVVTQEDRETYADEVERFGDKEYADRIRAGQRDTLSMLSMLARHRAAAEQRGFKLCQDAMDREAIARIIDPHAWERRDEFAALLRGEGLSSHTSLAEMQKPSAARRVDKVVADSIAKADAIRTLSIKGTGNDAQH